MGAESSWRRVEGKKEIGGGVLEFMMNLDPRCSEGSVGKGCAHPEAAIKEGQSLC